MLHLLLLSMFLLHPQEVADPVPLHPMELSPEIKAFLDEKIDRGLPQEARLQALASALFPSGGESQFTYEPVTRTAIETFTKRSGNCLSFALLFIPMARYIGLDARFREVEIAPVWSRAEAFVSLHEHINVAVFVGRAGYVVDVFPGINRIEVGGLIVSDARGLAHYYNNIAAAELGQSNTQAAISWLDKAVEIDPTAVIAWNNLGVAHAQLGELDEAERCYREALELNRKHAVAMSNLANVLQRKGKYREASRYIEKVKRFREENPYYHYNLGIQSYEVGDFAGAIQHYRRAIKLKPKEHNIHAAMARAYIRLSQYEDAQKSLQLAIKYSPDSSIALLYNEKLRVLKSIESPGA